MTTVASKLNANGVFCLIFNLHLFRILNNAKTCSNTRKSSLLTNGTTKKLSRSKTAVLNYSELISRTSGNSSRINPSSNFLVELLNAVHFCVFNEVTTAVQALDEIHKVATISLYSDVLLVSCLQNYRT